MLRSHRNFRPYLATVSNTQNIDDSFASRRLLRALCIQNALSIQREGHRRLQLPNTVVKRTFTPARVTQPTIYALSTAPGRAAIAIIRCSGQRCLDVYRSLCPDKALPKPRHATLRILYGPSHSEFQGQVLDSGSLVFYFPAPKTVTGEDIIEFHVHGGTAVVKAVLAGISQSVTGGKAQPSGIRYAEPGEFTRRAFYNNRLDLTQVEALGDTLTAETEQQRQLAVRGTSNTLNDRYEKWRHLLLQARGELEALIDFSEDQHFDESPAEFTASITNQIKDLRRRVQASIKNAAKGELLRGGINIALLGAPNAGKSSLLNQIVGREAAIVSTEAGTTRDVVEVNVDIGGYFCKFGDLAGLRSAGPVSSSGHGGTHAIGEVEQEGIRRAKARAISADVIIVVLEVQAETANPGAYSVQIDPEVTRTLAGLDMEEKKVLFVVNKSDLLPSSGKPQLFEAQLPRPVVPANCEDSPIFHISCVDPDLALTSIQQLLAGLRDSFASLTAASSLDDALQGLFDESLGASERQRFLLIEARDFLDDFLSCVGQSQAESALDDSDVDVVVAAESLRMAAQALGKITGRGESGDVEEVLGVVFEKFCVGK